jgi:hypothetical protein
MPLPLLGLCGLSALTRVMASALVGFCLLHGHPYPRISHIHSSAQFTPHVPEHVLYSWNPVTFDKSHKDQDHHACGPKEAAPGLFDVSLVVFPGT